MDWSNWCSVSLLCQEQGAVVPSGAGLPQGQGFGAQGTPGISTGHSMALPPSLGVGRALPPCAQGFQTPQVTTMSGWARGSC